MTPLGLYDTIGWEVAGNFAGKSGEETEWEFVKQPFDPYSVQIDGAGQAVFPYVAGNVSYVLAAYLYRENQVEWIDSEYIIWQNSGQIELPSEEGNYIYTEGQRLRLQGGKVLTLLNADDQVTSLPASFIRTQALVSLLRAVPDTIVGENGTPIRREWELRAALEMAQLPRMQSVRHLR